MTRRSLLLLVLLIGVAVGLRAAHALGHPDELSGDAIVYHRLGSQLLDEGYLGYGPDRLRSWRPPLYPAFLAAVYSVFGTVPLAAKLVQSALGGVVTFLVFLLGRRLASVPAGLAGAAVYALLANEIRHCATVYPEPLIELLLALSCLLLLRPEGPRRALLLALLAALLIHLQPAFVTVPAVGLLCVVAGRDGRRRLVCAATLCLATLLLLVPWTLRNYAVHGRFVFVSTNGGFNLLKGNHPGASGGPQTREELRRFEHLKARKPPGLSEVDSDAWYRRQALEFIAEHPGTYLRLALRRLRCWVLPLHFLQPGSWWPVTFGTIYPFVLLGLIVLIRQRASLLPPLLLLASVALPSVLVVYVGWKYRLPAVPLLATFAGCGIVALLRRLRGFGFVPVADRLG